MAPTKICIYHHLPAATLCHTDLGASDQPRNGLTFFPKQFAVRGSQFFLKLCPPFVSLLVSALFRWPCSKSIHLSPKSVTAGVRWACSISIHLSSRSCPPFSAGHVACLFICLPGLSLVVSALFRWPCSISIHLSPRFDCWCPPFSAGDATFLFVRGCQGLSILS